MDDQHHPPVTHHYDDIEEQDNPLPRWWLVTFFGTIVFGAVYFYHYEVFRSGLDQQQELDDEVAAAAAISGKTAPVTTDELLAMTKDGAATNEGAATFATTCAPCHGDRGEGKIGPNLTDDAWLHGGKATEVFHTVSRGVPDKGMPGWEQSLGHRKTEKVAAFVLSLRGTNVPGKPAQGAEDKGD